MPSIEGVTITADALHCQRETCDLIVQEGGSYCLQLKGNQGDMKADARAFIDDQETDYMAQFTNCMHGRAMAVARQARGEAFSSSSRWNHRR